MKITPAGVRERLQRSVFQVILDPVRCTGLEFVNAFGVGGMLGWNSPAPLALGVVLRQDMNKHKTQGEVWFSINVGDYLAAICKGEVWMNRLR